MEKYKKMRKLKLINANEKKKISGK